MTLRVITISVYWNVHKGVKIEKKSLEKEKLRLFEHKAHSITGILLIYHFVLSYTLLKNRGLLTVVWSWCDSGSDSLESRSLHATSDHVVTTFEHAQKHVSDNDFVFFRSDEGLMLETSA